jgi:hypothetical protein
VHDTPPNSIETLHPSSCQNQITQVSSACWLHGRTIHFAERARQIFTRGLPSKNPVDLVEQGYRTLDEWIRVLDAQREHEACVHRTRAQVDCRFSGKNALRFSILEQLERDGFLTRRQLQDRLVSLRPAMLRKLLTRLLEGGQLETVEVPEASEGMRFRITQRGQRELQHRNTSSTGIRRIVPALTRASKSIGVH